MIIITNLLIFQVKFNLWISVFVLTAFDISTIFLSIVRCYIIFQYYDIISGGVSRPFLSSVSQLNLKRTGQKETKRDKRGRKGTKQDKNGQKRIKRDTLFQKFKILIIFVKHIIILNFFYLLLLRSYIYIYYGKPYPFI